MREELERWQEGFREHLAVRGFSPKTVSKYVGELKPLFGYLHGQGVESLAQLTREHLEGYRVFLFYLRQRRRPERSLTLQTQGLRLQAVKCFLRFLYRTRVLLVDLSVHVDLPRVPRTLPRVLLTESEAQRLVECSDGGTPLDLRDRAVLELLYGTGLRNGELIALRLEHLDFSRHMLCVECGKGGKSRLVPLGEEAEAWLSAWLERGRPQFLQNWEERRVFLTTRGRRFHTADLVRLVGRWARRAGLEKKVTPHTLRHCCATHMLRRGAGLRHLQVMLGHASADTTQRYTRVELSDLRRVLLRCHPRERA